MTGLSLRVQPGPSLLADRRCTSAQANAQLQMARQLITMAANVPDAQGRCNAFAHLWRCVVDAEIAVRLAHTRGEKINAQAELKHLLSDSGVFEIISGQPIEGVRAACLALGKQWKLSNVSCSSAQGLQAAVLCLCTKGSRAAAWLALTRHVCKRSGESQLGRHCYAWLALQA